jgi:hypothetical protein
MFQSVCVGEWLFQFTVRRMNAEYNEILFDA